MSEPLAKWSKLGQANEVQKRLSTFTRRMAPGSLGGRTELASPAAPIPENAPTSQETFWKAKKASGGSPATMTVGPTAPLAPLVNDVWVDTS